jgi:hypothetical protein
MVSGPWLSSSGTMTASRVVGQPLRTAVCHVSASVDRLRRTAGRGLPKAAARKGLSCGHSRRTDSSCGDEP